MNRFGISLKETIRGWLIEVENQQVFSPRRATMLRMAFSELYSWDA